MRISACIQVVCGLVGPRCPDEQLSVVLRDTTPVAVLEAIALLSSNKSLYGGEPSLAGTCIRVVNSVRRSDCNPFAYIVRRRRIGARDHVVALPVGARSIRRRGSYVRVREETWN
jgi:hypothetical protein